MPRPIEYTEERLKEINSYQAERLFNKTNHFLKEKDLCDYIEKNIQLFCIDVLKEDYKNHKREFILKAEKIFPGHGNKIDFYIQTKKKNIFIECKNPSHITKELLNAISQIMYYKILAKEINIKVDDFYILTTK